MKVASSLLPRFQDGATYLTLLFLNVTRVTQELTGHDELGLLCFTAPNLGFDDNRGHRPDGVSRAGSYVAGHLS